MLYANIMLIIFIVWYLFFIEARIEQAKRIQRSSDYVKLPKYDKSCGGGSSAAGLISIQRLPVPNKNKEHLPLVEYWHGDSER